MATTKKNPGLEPGSKFRGLQVHSTLGEGAMGAAILASHAILKHPVVIRTFHVQGSDDVFQEAHLAARVVSPHVVGVLDAGVEAGARETSPRPRRTCWSTPRSPGS